MKKIIFCSVLFLIFPRLFALPFLSSKAPSENIFSPFYALSKMPILKLNDNQNYVEFNTIFFPLERIITAEEINDAATTWAKNFVQIRDNETFNTAQKRIEKTLKDNGWQ